MSDRITRVGNNGYYLDRENISRDQRYRGMAKLWPSNPEDSWTYDEDFYAVVNLRTLRDALDKLTLEESESVAVPLRDFQGDNEVWNRVTHEYDRNPHVLVFRLGNGGSRVRVKAPCGETRVYSVKTLDRALSALGY